MSINAQNTKVKRSVSAATKVQSEGNTYKLIGTIGQNAIGKSCTRAAKTNRSIASSN